MVYIQRYFILKFQIIILSHSREHHLCGSFKYDHHVLIFELILALKVSIVMDPNLSSGETFTDGGSSIKVTTDDEKKSISFQSFTSLGCIMAQQSQW